MSRIYFRTTAYNAEETVARCIESALNQTKYGGDILYYICDNGSTDRTGEIILEYASRDSRIKAFSNKINRVWEPEEREFAELCRSLEDDDLYCLLDADDSYDLDFLEKIIPFMKENRLDIAACGNKFIDVGTNAVTGTRVLPEPLIIGGSADFSRYFPYYHQFMRTVWGKLYTGKAARRIYTNETVPPKYRDMAYGSDTLYVFAALRGCERAGIYPEPLYNYYVSSGSASYKWDKRRVDSDRLLYEDAAEFLSLHGGLSYDNRMFLDLVYANAVTDTLNVLNNADGMTPAERLTELKKIADCPYTSEAFSVEHQHCRESKTRFLSSVLRAASELGAESERELRSVTEKYTPSCAPAVDPRTAELFAREKEFLKILTEDNRPLLIELLIKYIGENKFVKQYDLAGAVFALTKENPLLCGIKNAKFLKRYGGIYLSVLAGRYGEALEQTADILVKKYPRDEELILLCCNLAALLEQADEFIFAKTRLAAFYFYNDRIEECMTVLEHLEYMRVEDTEEIGRIKERIGFYEGKE
ncbi:MAG: glycosyltransferase [Bacteroides sp.]|nr:glycosyltransferase [Bacteroides sp.]